MFCLVCHGKAEKNFPYFLPFVKNISIKTFSDGIDDNDRLVFGARISCDILTEAVKLYDLICW
jgi:hypothetical protein